jgi:rubrerythrin
VSFRREAGEAWAFRARVEDDAEQRFARLAAIISQFDPGSPLPAMLLEASADEQRHSRLCAGLAAGFGVEPDVAKVEYVSIAPKALDARRAALYEMVAACCITETESVSTVTTLLAEEAEEKVRAVLHEIARDEVGHAQMGWAHLAREAAAIDVSFLSPLVPQMLAGTVAPDFFAQREPESTELMRYGVLPHQQKREIFLGTLREIVLPGLDRHGVDPKPAQLWLDERQR